MSNTQNKPTGRKRGRKPKGGKIINDVTSNKKTQIVKPNIILHLKCNQKDIDCYKVASDITYSGDNLINNKLSNLQYQEVNEMTNDNSTDIIPDPDCINKEIYTKLKKLQMNLHVNNISDKKSACFWCTCDFDSPPIYIPKYDFKETYYVYGCFCSPECAAAYLFNENIDSSVKFERYHLLNFIYSKIYNYTKNIKPAPSPFYTLDKYFGNLSTIEYRKLLNNDRLLIVVDKPLTRELPELIETNDDILYKPHTMIKLHETSNSKPISNIFS